MDLTNSIRYLFLTLSLLAAIEAYGESVKLLPCLGKEEALLYKKREKGSLYKLNQNLINTLVDSPELVLAPNYDHLICSKNYSASKQVLLYGVLYGSKIFSYNKQQQPQAEFFTSKLPQLFFRFLSDIQSEMPNANCLAKEIPEIKYFLERYKYLQEDLSEKELFLQENQKIRNIFKGLSSYSALYKKCKRIKN